MASSPLHSHLSPLLSTHSFTCLLLSSTLLSFPLLSSSLHLGTMERNVKCKNCSLSGEDCLLPLTSLSSPKTGTLVKTLVTSCFSAALTPLHHVRPRSQTGLGQQLAFHRSVACYKVLLRDQLLILKKQNKKGK